MLADGMDASVDTEVMDDMEYNIESAASTEITSIVVRGFSNLRVDVYLVFWRVIS